MKTDPEQLPDRWFSIRVTLIVIVVLAVLIEVIL